MTRSIASIILLAATTLFAGAQTSKINDEGVLPTGADGKPLNFDFETGTLKDWHAEGKAFDQQPIKGDTVSPRRSDMKSQHQGQYWIGGYERLQDKPMGTLTSVPFRVTHPWASFLIGGGPWKETCVELVRKDSGKVFFRANGIEQENLRRVVVDLQPHQKKEIFIRLVDRRPGHWGHLNFDDFRFHQTKPDFPPRPVPKTPQAPDTYKFAGLPPEKAAEAMTVPEGFDVKLFAGEPDVHQPIALCLDDRGRVWVAEAYCYPKRKPHKGPLVPKGVQGDRIVVFEDTDGDGKHDKRTVFLEGLNLVSGLEVGFGGVWIGAAPYLLFVPDKNGDDRPDGPPQILLDGWGYHDTHETLNAFIWGPDGWLYGCHGVFTHSRVGRPGTPDKDRVPINAGIWRYHPTRHKFEVFAHGTSNPWGLDYNDYGQFFVEACVIPHAFHIIQGGRYHRQAGAHFNPYTYVDIKTIADHRHYLGATPHSGNNFSDSMGGGHAHCGTMIYLGGAWPEKYRNQFFMGNIHGRRLNMDILKAKGSGYVASHGKDFLLANDAYARFINMRYGPDGNVYLIDWYDKQACHNRNPQIWDRTNGRIFKICYRGAKEVKNVDLQKLSDAELVDLQMHENDWHVRHARRILQERCEAKPLHGKLAEKLHHLALHANKKRLQLRALWALHATGSLKKNRPEILLNDRTDEVRAWAIQFINENETPGEEALKMMGEVAERESSPIVRLYLASACQRLPHEQRWDILKGLLSHSEDAGDHNLPLMYWYAAEPLAEESPEKALALTAQGKIPQVHAFMIRRIASNAAPKALALLVKHLHVAKGSAVQQRYLNNINLALKGRRNVDMPKEWQQAFVKLGKSKNGDIRSQALALAVTFGDPRAFAELRRVAANKKADTKRRHTALTSLVDARDEKLPPLLQKLIAEDAMRAAALRGLAAYDDANTPKAILDIFAALDANEKRDALNTLASRVSYAKQLLNALAAKKVASSEVPADVIRQLRNLRNKELDKQVIDVWGIVRNTPAARKKLIAKYRRLVRSSGTTPDLALGRAVFAKTCQQCHKLFGIGGTVGPDITGANRSDINYVLENILDPSAVIPKEYAASLVELKNGRFITGIIKQKTKAAVMVVLANETLTLPMTDIAELTSTPQSMMPDDQLKPMSQLEIVSLVAYIQSKTQTPMLATPENAKQFFNGKDLTGWTGDPKLWKVENGEIVGNTTGLKRNEFLRSDLAAEDFELTLKVKLIPNTGNSGVQFRSKPEPDGEMKGLQADIGKGWWGKLYDERGRGLLWAKSGEKHVKPGDWNEYKIIAKGAKIRTWINGQLCVDFTDPTGSKRGIFALQLHSGPSLEVRFKDLRLMVAKK